MLENNAKNQSTINELINWSTQYLKENGVKNPRTSSEILLSFTLNLKRIDLYLKYDEIINKEKVTNFKEFIKRRAQKEPLQYIIGITEFMSIPFKVNPTVFIPRPETELLVEQIMDISKRKWKNEKVVNILDIGTGSGNIAISFAKYINNSHIIAIDISDDILKIAEENAKMNDVTEKITFKKLSIFDANQIDFENINIVASNPPYISLNDYLNLEDEVRHYEPEICLQDYGNGLTFFKIICEKSKEWLIDNGFLFMEMGFGESQDVYNIIKSYGFSNIKILKDYQQIDRVIFCENKK